MSKFREQLALKLNVEKIDDVVVEGIDTTDYPDFCDAYIESAILIDNGECRDATESELDIINEDHDFVYSEVENVLY